MQRKPQLGTSVKLLKSEEKGFFFKKTLKVTETNHHS